jgi:Sec-independent protein translocase protein TatA
MKTRIKQLIDEHVIQPLANAITTRLQEAFDKIMTAISEVRTAVNDLKQSVADEHARIDARLDNLTKQLEAKATEHDDSELTALAAEIRGVTTGLTTFHPTEATNKPAEDPNTGPTSGGTAAEGSEPNT